MTRVHFIGICGTAMATVAAMLKHQGCDVSGSDQDVYPPMSEFLAAEGISVLSGYETDHITPDLDCVVVGNAISRGNRELEAVALAFRRFVNLVPRRGLVLIGADSPGACRLRSVSRSRLETFGLASDADWQADDVQASDTATRFRVRHGGASFATFELPLLG